MNRMQNCFRLAACCGVLLLWSVLTGCADNSPGVSVPASTNGLTAGGATSLYAIQQPSSASSSILQFSLAGGGTSLTPTSTLTAPSGVLFNSLAVDSTGQIYAGAYLTATGQGEVLVYPAGSAGVATPSRTIAGGLSTSTTTFARPQSMQVNSAGTLAILSYTTLGYTVTTLPASSTGTVTPTTNLGGANTLMTGVQCVSIDASGKIYITNYGSSGAILEFAATATGNTAPTTVITTGTSAPYGIGTDSSGNIYTVLDSPTGGVGGSLVTYAPTATGAAVPTATITGSSTGIFFGGGLRVDSVGNVYLINQNSTGTAFSFVAFKGGTTGNATPPLTFSSTALTAPTAEIAVH